MQRRVTQQDVAHAAGVNRATVSMALRQHPSIPERTRNRIVRLAKRLGYVPDPMLSALAVYRSQRQPAGFRGTLAWLVNSAFGFNWREHPHFFDYYKGAAARAEFYGYTLDTFDLHAPGQNPGRIAAILRARRVPGLLLCPQPRPETNFHFPWQDFSSLTFGYTLANPRLHTVAAAHYRATVETMKQLHQRRYRRIGLALDKIHDQRTDHNYRAGYLVGQQLYGFATGIPPLIADYDDLPALRTWITRYKPDAILTGNHQFLEPLNALNLRAPDDVGVACPVLPSARTQLSGMVEGGVRMGAVAVDFLVSMINRNERGLPATAECIQVQGHWHEGASLRPAHAATAPSNP